MAKLSMEQYQKKLESWILLFPNSVKASLEEGTRIVKKEWARRWSGPVLQKRSGELVNALDTKTSLRPLSGIVYVVSFQKYKAITHEEGRTIRPIRRKVLRFYIAGKPVFAKEVRIPARPAAKDSLQAKRGEIRRIILRGIMGLYRRL